MIKTPRNGPCSDWEDNWADRLKEYDPERDEKFYMSKLSELRVCKKCKKWTFKKLCPFCGRETREIWDD